MITALQINFAIVSTRHWVALNSCGEPLGKDRADLKRDVAHFKAIAQARGAISDDNQVITEEGGN
ncbi:hypothetical protein R3X27_16450 [Tropicimonas sp. TH_r6]|uniref:hypothetical protein n=1 Tax=Tropicimonas sp. TH_r6 TaxID=3082085 RepID=UPI0029555784|nr:hypothetical protein [Tropicimonas sp. TH_r6]MDV7144277.1 hypothetical protein [Tropicimonas sp. TH_r6]